ncbi:MAG: single-stranded DNA-binding protein [Solirubrobacteraceae bacterium]
MPSTNINHVVLTGRLTSDPDLRTLPSGNSICHLRLAVNGRRRETSGEWVEKPNFFDVTIFGGPAENVAKYVYKGRPVAVDGRLDWRTWELPDGRPAQAVSVIAKTVQFLGSPPSDSDDGLPDFGTGALEGIAGGEEEALEIGDQEAIATAAAAG